jgi:hypothetical protein
MLAHARLLYDELPALDATLKAFIGVPSRELLEEARALFSHTGQGLQRENSVIGCFCTWFRCCCLSCSCFSACGCVPVPLHSGGGQHLNMS